MISIYDRKPQEVIITVPSKPEYVGWARRVVENLAQDGGIPKETIEDITLAVGEACNNAILHGSPEGERNTVSVECQVNDKKLIVKVRDQGFGFRLSQARKVPPVDYSEGGRGLLLIRMLMDEVSYRRAKDGGVLKMVKHLAA